jgi:hypothetical protein
MSQLLILCNECMLISKIVFANFEIYQDSRAHCISWTNTTKAQSNRTDLSQHICPIDLLMKEHRPPFASGLRARAIISNNNYFTCQESDFLHCLLPPKVFSHPFVLRDSLSFVRMLDNFEAKSTVRE